MARLKKRKQIKRNKGIVKTSILRIVVLLLIVGLNWTGLLAIGQTISYFNDIENSVGSFTAGGLDFHLYSPEDFSPGAISPGESAERTISFLNDENIPKYKVKSVNFSGTLCDYLTLQVKLDGVDIEYNGLLIDFDYGPVVFETPKDYWTFILTLPADAPEPAQGQICNFNFLFYGSQTENNLPFGGGFNDIEENISNIASKICQDTETRSKGYWKNHESVYSQYFSQYLGCIGGNEEISTPEQVTAILGTDYELSMRNKLRGQLLAMKFNVAHFSVGEYFVAAANQTINQIIIDADNLLRQVPEPEPSELEAMKYLLDSLNQDLQIRICSLAPLLTISSESQLTSNDIVLNEFLPNPAYNFGEDDSLMPYGEWVELYNKGTIAIDVSDWYVYDQDFKGLRVGDHLYPLIDPDTTIDPGEFMVVFRNGDIEFELDNTDSDGDGTVDIVSLYDGDVNSGGRYVDGVAYNANDLGVVPISPIDWSTVYPTPLFPNVGTGEDEDRTIIPENKSFARIPDGTGDWVDPYPTPGWSNRLNPEEIFTQNEEQEEVLIQVVEETPIPKETPNEIINDEIFDNTIFDDTIEDEDAIIDVPDVDPVDTVTPSQDGVDIIYTEDDTEGADIPEDTGDNELFDEIVKQDVPIDIPDVDIIKTVTSAEDGIGAEGDEDKNE